VERSAPSARCPPGGAAGLRFLEGASPRFLWTAGGDLDLVGLAELPASAIPTLKAIVDGAGTFAYARILEVFDTATMDAAAAAGSNYRPVGQ
jgi:hypothetical protein